MNQQTLELTSNPPVLEVSQVKRVCIFIETSADGKLTLSGRQHAGQ